MLLGSGGHLPSGNHPTFPPRVLPRPLDTIPKVEGVPVKPIAELATLNRPANFGPIPDEGVTLTARELLQQAADQGLVDLNNAVVQQDPLEVFVNGLFPDAVPERPASIFETNGLEVLFWSGSIFFGGRILGQFLLWVKRRVLSKIQSKPNLEEPQLHVPVSVNSLLNESYMFEGDVLGRPVLPYIYFSITISWGRKAITKGFLWVSNKF